MSETGPDEPTSVAAIGLQKPSRIHAELANARAVLSVTIIPQPCPICEGAGTRPQMEGARMNIIECEICNGTGDSQHDPA